VSVSADGTAFAEEGRDQEAIEQLQTQWMDLLVAQSDYAD